MNNLLRPVLGAGAGLFALHTLLIFGLLRELPLPARLSLWPQLWAGLGRREVWALLLPEVLLSSCYLLAGLLLAWALAGLLERAPEGLGWLTEGATPYLWLVLLIWAGLSWTLARDLNFPLRAWHPLMLGLIALSLALPLAGRASLVVRSTRRTALEADYTRTARAMGLPEAQVRAQAGRVALPERARSLSGDALGVGLSLVIIEGLLQFGGLGNEVYTALQGSLSEGGVNFSVSWGDPTLPWQLLSGALLALLILSALAAAALRALAGRLDPRPRVGGS